MTAKKRLLFLTLLSLVSLALIDLLSGALISGFDYEPRGTKIETYFSYGVSTSRKLQALVGEEDAEAAPIARAGWNIEWPTPSATGQADCSQKVSIYGMSFSNRIGEHMQELNPCLEITKIAGPGAPLSHSYYSYTRLSESDKSDYVILAVLASALPKINTVAHLNSAFEYPGAHFYPRYYLEGEELKSSGVPAESLEQLRSLLKDPDGVDSLKSFMEKFDSYYNEYVFSHQWADYSSSLRMLRRSYAQTAKREVISRYYNGKEFTNHSRMIDLSRELVESFVANVRQNGQTPVLVLINNKGHANSLEPIFEQTIQEQNILSISSTNFIDSQNLSNFEDDGHFKPEMDRLLASAVLDVISATTEDSLAIQTSKDQ